MKAIDTNILVRLLVERDTPQANRARALLMEGVFIGFGVFMEAEWVLRSTYGLTDTVIADGFENLLATGHAVSPHDADMLWAIGRMRQGADLADMLHIASARGYDAFATFEKRLGKQAGPDSPLPVIRV